MNPNIFSAGVLALAFPLIAIAASAGNLPATGASTAPQTQPGIALHATSPTAASTKPDLTVAPPKITNVELSSTKLTTGAPLVVKVHVTGVQEQYCTTRIIIDQLTPQLKNNYKDLATAFQSGALRKYIFNFSEAGTYKIRLELGSGAPPSCGYKGEGTIPGDLTKFEVFPAVAK